MRESLTEFFVIHESLKGFRLLNKIMKIMFAVSYVAHLSKSSLKRT